MEVDSVQEEIDGIIHSIRVRNFFCHENLEISFNPNVNFIVGRNGSGKSAVLTALVVGLGARASATNRGSNLHSFIKKGANSATVEIKIKNSSVKAYKPNVYGDFITIVRTITASGSSNYKVKSASGEVISTKLSEVHAIVLAHDIQVDNPISVLNQDDARSFHASDAKKKYSLFRRATNLDESEANYTRALENCDKAKIVWKRKYEACLELEKECKKWFDRHEQMQSRDEINENKRSLQLECYWSEVLESEKDAANLQAQYNKHNSRIEKLVAKCHDIERNFGNNSGIIQSLKSSIEEKNAVCSSLEEELRQLEGEKRDLQTAYRSSQHSNAKQHDLYTRENRKVADLEREIENIKSGEASMQRAELEARAQAAAQAAAVMQARFNTAQNDAQQARLNNQRATQTAEECTSRAQRQRDTLRHLKTQLRELESRGADSLAVYGNKMVELCQSVRDANAKGMFSAMPRGPVGAFLKVREKKWASALEHIIGNAMQSFCVNSPEDSRKLFEIMGNVYGSAPKPGVTCSKFLNKQHDVRKNQVRASGFHSVLDSIEVRDPVVANYLIDNMGIERILLVPDHDSAIKLSDSVENVPVNCSKVVTLDSTEFHPAPNYRSYGGANSASRYLQVSTADRKRQIEVEIRETEGSLATLVAKAEECSREAKSAMGAERETSRVLQALLTDRHEKDSMARAAAALLDQHQMPRHQVLLEELELSKEKLRSINAVLSDFSEKENELKSKEDSYDAKIKSIKTKLSQATTESRNLSDQVEQEQLKLDQSNSDKERLSQKLREDRQTLAQALEILNEKKQNIEKKIAEASDYGPRVANPRDKSLLMNELKKMQMKLNSIRNEDLSKEQVAGRLQFIQNKYKNTKLELDSVQKVIAELQKISMKHFNFFQNLRKVVAQKVQISFKSILRIRGYSGDMDIDMENGTLNMWCAGREAGGKRKASSTSSLSGGERSYCTVAFIMALWECVELPFYFMDEFDVFMDNVNRKIVMELLIDHALNNGARQFVFLTPQDVSSVTSGPQIKIHRMADPRH